MEKNKKRLYNISGEEFESLLKRLEGLQKNNKFEDVQPFTDLLSHPLFERNHKVVTGQNTHFFLI
jgi:hypothetical protein